MSGAFDCFPEYHRRQYIAAKDGDISLTEKVIKYSAKMQQESQSAQASLFGSASGTQMPLPKIDPIEPFSEIEKLHFEKEVVGVYISGHPLDNFKFEMEVFCNTPVASLTELEGNEGKECKVGGIVASVEHRMTKTGRPFGKLFLEDYSGKSEIVLWSDDYLKFKSFLMPGLFLFIEGNIVRKSWGEQNLEFKIRSIDLLNELATKKVNGLALRFEVQAVTPLFIESIEKLCKKNSGTAVLRMYLKDDEASLQAEVLSRSARIKPTNLLINELKRLADVGVVTDKQEVRWLTEQSLKLTQKTEVGMVATPFALEEVES